MRVKVLGWACILALLSLLWLLPLLSEIRLFSAYYGLQVSKPVAEIYSIDHQDRDFSLSLYRGKYFLLFFGFTHCATLCPVTLSSLTSLVKELDGVFENNLKILFVTLDRHRDTINQMKNFILSRQLNEKLIGVLAPDNLETIMTRYNNMVMGLKQMYEPTEQIIHSGDFYFIDPHGRIRLIYKQKKPDFLKVKKDLIKFYHENKT